MQYNQEVYQTADSPSKNWKLPISCRRNVITSINNQSEDDWEYVKLNHDKIVGDDVKNRKGEDGAKSRKWFFQVQKYFFTALPRRWDYLTPVD